MFQRLYPITFFKKLQLHQIEKLRSTKPDGSEQDFMCEEKYF